MTDSAAFSLTTYKRVFGLEKSSDIAYVEALSSSLAQIDRGLLPPPAGHPLQRQIEDSAVDELLELASRDDEVVATDALDALAHVFNFAAAAEPALQRLRALLTRDVGVEHKAMVLKVLAIGQDRALLRRQVELLADDDPGVVATAARLLGFGRVVEAVPLLKNLIASDRIYESRYVIWALGEIGDADALPQLEYALTQGFRTVDCLIAMGKIGELNSIPKLTPMILGGLPEQREAAYRALAMILNQNRDIVSELTALRRDLSELVLAQLIDDGMAKSSATRFHMCLVLARLGQKLDAALVRRYLGLPLAKEEASAMASFFMR